MAPETKFEYYRDVLIYIYENDIERATALLSNLPFKPITSEANLVESALQGIQYRRYDRAAFAVRRLSEVFTPDDLATAVLDERLDEIKLRKTESMAIRQIAARQRTKEPPLEVQIHFPDLDKYSPSIILTRWLVGFLALAILIQFIGLKFDRDERAILNRANNGDFVSNTEAVKSDDQQLVIGIAFLVAFISWFIPFLFWMRRRYKNLTAFGATQLEYSAKWTWLGFIIPILNLTRPYKVAQEIWRESYPYPRTSITSYFNSSPDSDYVSLWWYIFLGTNLISNFGGRFFESDETIDSFLAANAFSHVERVLIIVQYIVTTVFILKLSERQQEKYNVLVNTAL